MHCMHLFWGRTSLSFVSPVFLHMSAYLDCGLKLGRINTFPSHRPSHLRVLHKHHNSGQRIRDAQGAQSGDPAFKVCSSRSAITSMYLLTIYKDLLGCLMCWQCWQTGLKVNGNWAAPLLSREAVEYENLSRQTHDLYHASPV